MNILILTNKMPYPPIDGGAIAMSAMIEGLQQAGNTVSVLAMNTPKHFVNTKQLNLDQKATHFEVVTVDTQLSAVAALRNLLFSGQPYNAIRFYSEAYRQKLEQFLRAHTFDIVQLEGLYLASYIPIVRRLSKAKIAMRAHNVEHEIWQRTARGEQHPLRKWYLQLLAKRLKRMEVAQLSDNDILVPISRRDADMFRRLGNTKPVHVCPTGINIATALQAVPVAEHRHFYHIGAMDWLPNQEGLLWFVDNVWTQIQRENPDLQFHIAGRNAPAWLVKRLVVSGVVFHGEVPDAAAFAANYQLMIVPLLSGSGMRIKIIEAMAAGKTILTTPIGIEGIDAVAGEHFLVADNAHNFIAQLKKIASGEQSIAHIGRNANIFVGKYYNNDKITATLSAFYQKQLSE